jgi:flagellar basal-body rod protein FlgF
MDRAIYLGMNGAMAAMDKMAVTSNNLANASTQGFRAEFTATKALYATGDGLPTRAFSVAINPGVNMTPGPIMPTGGPLDAAIEGPGFFAIQDASGAEAYTRFGQFRVDAEGQLQTSTGHPVLGDGGPVQIPAGAKVSIGNDGTISSVDPKGFMQKLGRLKLVDPAPNDVTRGVDGLFRTTSPSEPSPLVRVAGGALEGSNTNTVEEMVRMIDTTRQYDMSIRMMQAAEQNGKAAASILSGL